ncbi:uncharacterized protein LOC132735324 [Ruditapes philippinarum]|uniref:uncharacterized protein LOC132735324 n=1 Tax=Ruditapes philippinarum TaxID=129788 RepID=UPI00295AD535|nr:uncharacterized protein LOC132735324 [Ruditapes philippinarum]
MLWCLCLFILFARVSRVDSEGPKECLPNDLQGCSCKFSDDSGIIDLTSLGTSDNTPRFKDVQGQDSNVYSFSACNAFTEGKCVNAAMCMQEEGYQTVIGEPGRTLFKYDPGTESVTAAYVVRGSLIMVSEVELVCDPAACDPVFLPQGQSTVGLFNFQLTHVCACPGLCNEKGPINCVPKSGTGSGLGFGYVFIIVCLCIALMYFAVGTVFQKVKYKATGTDLVPNKDRWKGLFGLITLGFRFTFSKCLPKKYQYNDIN